MKRQLVSFIKRVYDKYVSFVSGHVQAAEKPEIVYLMSFPGNDHGFIADLAVHYPITVFYTNACRSDAAALTNVRTINLNRLSGLTTCLKKLKQVSICICDNYFALLGNIDKSNGLKVIQVWHAGGAIKQFGLEDKTAQKRSESDKARFKRVYDSFDYIVVGSEKMAAVFERSYGVSSSNIWLTGFPRTDYLIDRQAVVKEEKSKKAIVYLPTYRDQKEATYPLDIKKMAEQLAEEYHLIVKEHPHSQWQIEELYQSSFVTYAPPETSADDLVNIADVLITDYSSTAFDYSLVHPDGRLIFYWYDVAMYCQTTGIQKNIEQDFPLPVCQTTDEVIAQVLTKESGSLAGFNQKWNTYNDGQASQRLIQKIKHEMSDRT
ncbi:CDP-glycerol glycerophosphotransferase family protein [Vagococcus vulneris]|uniref:CDP-glycerol--poly(Glycerophosphate) glycerophosphotransferase n=1 Tax=Vagococcus vulneris TaxID=1977869 RepID=A0A429ZZS7_9ENTE|nr:CDP-glycerol glycerophosphotransferase family protein [Vagococcus vulneris]RST99558.1 hypothetical protein CBF37_04320 [Vagococcus vulneris]